MVRLLIRILARSRTRSAASGVVLTTAALAVYDSLISRTGRQELVDVSGIKPGETIVITALDVSHKQQIKDERRSKKVAKKTAKADAKAARVTAKATKAETKAARRQARRSRSRRCARPEQTA